MSAVVSAAAIAAALSLAGAVGILHNRRSGQLRTTEKPVDAGALGLSATGPTVVHFTAAWCGPCAAVRRVVDQVCAELPQVSHVEIDLDTHPDTARSLSVLSLPTTLIFDAEGRQRYRTSGVPSVGDLREALTALLG